VLCRLAARSTRQGDVISRRTPAAEDGEAAEELKKRLEKLNKQEQQQQQDPAEGTAGSRPGADKEAAAEDEDPNAGAWPWWLRQTVLSVKPAAVPTGHCCCCG